MSYFAQSKLVSNGDLMIRIAACAATQGVSNPESWANEHKWLWSVQPGWVAAYIGAGEKTSGVTDEMILAAVQKVIADETPPETDPATPPSPAE